MKKNEINIAKKTLVLLKKKLWSEIKFEQILKKNQRNNLRNKNDLIKNINRYVDYLLIKNSAYIEKSTNKDMLFEVIMMRFDILQQNRKSFLMLFDSFKKQPQQTIKFIPSFLESMILIAKIANIEIKGIKGNFMIKGIFLIYIGAYFNWLNDKSVSLEKTMNSLDDYLNQASKILDLI